MDLINIFDINTIYKELNEIIKYWENNPKSTNY